MIMCAYCVSQKHFLSVSDKCVEQLFIRFFSCSFDFIIDLYFLPVLEINVCKTYLSIIHTLIQEFLLHLCYIW